MQALFAFLALEMAAHHEGREGVSYSASPRQKRNSDMLQSRKKIVIGQGWNIRSNSWHLNRTTCGPFGESLRFTHGLVTAGHHLI
jgi:hypothetical protein